MNHEKPHKGTLVDWTVGRCANGLGVYIVGVFHGHPQFHGHAGHTSALVKLRPEINEVETLNSRYTLENPPLHKRMDYIKDMIALSKQGRK